MATPGLLSQIITSKFEDALPLYRQEKIFSRLGIDLPRSTMAGWMIKSAEAGKPIYDLICRDIRSGPLINMDETPVQVMNEPGRSNTSKSYMWVMRGGHESLVFHYAPTRSGSVPLELLSDYSGYVQTDGYIGYEALSGKKGIVLVGCWAHARRRFDKVIKARSNPKKRGLADDALDYIGELYKIEHEMEKKGCNAEERLEYRKARAKPLLEEFEEWLKKYVVATPPKGLLGKAIRYTLKYWPRLIRYTEDGIIRPDNNLAENAIRPFVVGRNYADFSIMRSWPTAPNNLLRGDRQFQTDCVFFT